MVKSVIEPNIWDKSSGEIKGATMMRKAKKTVEGDQTNEWRKSGSFVNKPQRGWLHPDNVVMGPGVVYAVQVWYISSRFHTHHALRCFKHLGLSK